MKGLVKLLVVGILVTVVGCSSSKLINRYSINDKINHELSYWAIVDSDSTFNSMKRYMDSNIRDYNLKQLRDNLDKDRNSPYWGESIYYMLHDLFK